jgi:hypothetical protein
VIIELHLEQWERSPRERAVRFSDSQGYFVSEHSGYRLLQALHRHKGRQSVHLQDHGAQRNVADRLTHFKIIGWGWLYVQTSYPAAPASDHLNWAENLLLPHRPLNGGDLVEMHLDFWRSFGGGVLQSSIRSVFGVARHQV